MHGSIYVFNIESILIITTTTVLIIDKELGWKWEKISIEKLSQNFK